jgi:hypothetical protein
MDKVKEMIHKLLFKQDENQFSCTDTVDKRGSTTYPPNDSGPKDCVIFGGIIISAVIIVRLIKKIRNRKKK